MRLTLTYLVFAMLALPAGASIRPHQAVRMAADKVSFSAKLVDATVSDTAVYGDSLFWTQTVPPSHGNVVPERLFYSSVSPIVKHLLFTFPSGTTVLRLSVSTDWVVASLSGTDGSSLWFMHRANHATHTLASWSVRSGVTFEGFDLDGDTVIYILDKLGSKRQGVFQIHSRMLPNGKDKVGYTQTMSCGGVSVSGVANLLWIGTRTYRCTGSDVVSIDPSTGDLTALTSTHNAIDAFSNGVYTGWIVAPFTEGGVGGKGKVELVKPGAAKAEIISRAGASWPPGCTAGKTKRVDTCASQPGITADLAYWINGANKPEVYDLKNGHSLDVTTENPPSIGGFGQGSGWRLSWASAVSQPTPGRPQSWIVVAKIKSPTTS